MKTFPDKIIWFCRIVGGLPLESATETRGTKALAFSTPAFLWSTTLVILQEIISSIVLYIYFMGRQHDLLSDAFTRTTDFATTLQVVSLQVTVAVIFLSFSRKYRRMVEVFDTLERVYRDHQCKTSEVKFTVKLWGICTIAVILATAAPIIHDEILSGRKLSMSLANIFLLLPYCSEVAVLVHFTHVTQIIAKSFRMINARIQKELISHAIERVEINSNLPNVDVIHVNHVRSNKSLERDGREQRRLTLLNNSVESISAEDDVSNQPSGPQGRKMKLLSEFLDGHFSIGIAQTQSNKTQETYLYTFNKADESRGVRGSHGRTIFQQWPHQVHKQCPQSPRRKTISRDSNYETKSSIGFFGYL
ncbi:hypothetical protein J6590_093014 [Homalodisca vitripennis]|nr:hypothetical protein J6590_093014 [Homalodisca vitripennis]